MSRYVNLDQIIADIYGKWGCDPAYIANDTPTGVEARRDAKLIEYLRSKPYIDIVRCEECKFFDGFSCDHALGLMDITKVSYCSYGRRKTNE